MIAGALLWAAAGAAAASASRPIGIADIVEVADPSSLATSPDGRLVAFRVDRPSITMNRVQIVWHVVLTDGRAPARRLADAGEAQFDGAGVLVEEPPQWSPDGRQLYYRASVDGVVQVWRVNIAGGAPEQVTRDMGDVRAFRLGADGRTLNYTAGPARTAVVAAEQAIRDRGGLVDDRVELAIGMVGGLRDNNRDRSVRLSGDWFERQGLLDHAAPRRLRLDLATGVASPNGYGTIASPAAAQPPGTLTDAAPPCPAHLCPGAITAWRLADGDAEWLAIRDAASRMRIYRRRTGAYSLVARSNGLLSGGRSAYEPCAAALGGLVCVVATAASPPQVMFVDGRTGTRRALADPNPTLRRVIGRVAQRTVEWRLGGQTFAGHLFGAEPGVRRPLVISYYSCDGFLRGGTGDELPMLPLAATGAATLCVNAPMTLAVRTGAPRRFGRYERAVDALSMIVDRLAGEGIVDRTRVGMQGLSFGSEVTIWAARHTKLLRTVAIASLQAEPATTGSTPRRGATSRPNLRKAGEWAIPTSISRAGARCPPPEVRKASASPSSCSCPSSRRGK